ncbi:hypothetical protein BGZ72_003445, partial [Mortierella alpina]
RTITQDDRAAGMEHRPSVLSPPGQDMGPTPYGPLRLSPEPQVAQVHVMETAPKSVRIRRNAALMEEARQSLPLPALEPHPSDLAETENRAPGSDPDNAILAIGDMVPDSAGDGSGSTRSSAPNGSSTRTRKRKQHPGQERQMESVGVARKRQALTKPLLSTTISVYMNAITRLMLPPRVRPPKLCALGSTLAALPGAPVADIM